MVEAKGALAVLLFPMSPTRVLCVPLLATCFSLFLSSPVPQGLSASSQSPAWAAEPLNENLGR